MSAIARNNVKVAGSGATAIVFAHGFGCDQAMWRHVAPAFAHDYRTVLFDHVGCGGADNSAYDARAYATLQRYADDVLEFCAELGLRSAVFVGHSVSAMIGILAAIRAPERIGSLVLVGPSPCYYRDGDYDGGFERSDLDGLLEAMDDNYLIWSRSFAPAVAGNAERPELADELASSFCRADPDIARQFARLTFLSDHRADLARVTVPTLVLQCAQDAIAPEQVGRYVHRQVRGSRFVQLAATGHCPHLSAPAETIAAIRSFLGDRA